MTVAEIQNFFNLGMVQKVLIVRSSLDIFTYYRISFVIADGGCPYLEDPYDNDDASFATVDGALSKIEHCFPGLPFDLPIQILIP
jgi:hypothetical protein